MPSFRSSASPARRDLNCALRRMRFARNSSARRFLRWSDWIFFSLLVVVSLMTVFYYGKNGRKSRFQKRARQISTLCEKKCNCLLAICVMMWQKSAALKRLLR